MYHTADVNHKLRDYFEYITCINQSIGKCIFVTRVYVYVCMCVCVSVSVGECECECMCVWCVWGVGGGGLSGYVGMWGERVKHRAMILCDGAVDTHRKK